jgi:hypothetical protein
MAVPPKIKVEKINQRLFEIKNRIALTCYSVK